MGISRTTPVAAIRLNGMIFKWDLIHHTLQITPYKKKNNGTEGYDLLNRPGVSPGLSKVGEGD